MTGTVMTVLGAIEADRLGPTLMHEHLFADVSVFWDPRSALDDGATRPMSASLAGQARWEANVVRDNLVIAPDADADVVEAEVRDFQDSAGPGACIVDLSTRPIGPYPDALRRMAERTGAHIVLGTGVYVDAVHPEWVRAATPAEVEARLEGEIVDGFGDSGVRAGIIGEIGTSAEVTASEEKVLRAAARVAGRTGLTLNVHCEPPELAVVHQILDLIDGEGLDPSRVYLSHLDEIADLDYHREVLRRGVVVGFDSFGQDNHFSPTWMARSDLEKGRTLMALVGEGFVDQLVLAQDVCRKSHLKAYGGTGLDHVTRRVVPRLIAHAGLTDEQAHTMLVATPRRLLANANGAHPLR